MHKLLRWSPFASVAAVAFALALGGSGPKGRRVELDANQLATAFAHMAKEEPALRAKAQKEFHDDPWSQDDAFHWRELVRARIFAATERVPVGVVLYALDEGLREGWPRPNGVELVATVPPCRPRPID